MINTSVADWNSASYMSGTLQAIKDVFARARKLSPSILFIDELDGISDRARLRGDYVEYWSQIVNLFLELLQGIDERPGVVVIGATNHPDAIDPAVRRAGRLDREIEIEKPDAKTLAKIFRYHLKDLLPDVDLMPAGLAARGATGADVEAYVRRARGSARRARRPLRLDDLLAEIRSRRASPSKEDRRRVAVHEAGHAVVATLLGGMDVAGVTIGDRDGVTEIVRVDGNVSPERCHEFMVMLLAGRAAEEMVFGTPSGGAGGTPGSDLGRATTLAKEMELRLGFGELGPVFVPEERHDALMTIPGLLGSVRRRLDRAMSDATKLLGRNRAALEEIADKLSLSGYLSATEIVDLVDAVNQARNGNDPFQSPEDGVETSLRRVREQIEETLAAGTAGDRGDAENPDGGIGLSHLGQRGEERPE